MHFCPTCGTTVFWEADLRPDHIGVAVGAFHDADFPRPTLSVWEESKHGWVGFTHDFAHYPSGEADLTAKRFWQAGDRRDQLSTSRQQRGGRRTEVFKNILIPTDGSDLAAKAVEQGVL